MADSKSYISGFQIESLPVVFDSRESAYLANWPRNKEKITSYLEEEVVE